MTYRTLLLPISDSPCGTAALATAVSIARAWLAHLNAVVVQIDSRDVAPLAGEGLSGAMIEDMMRTTEEAGAKRVGHLRASFDSAAQGLADAAFTVLHGRAEDLLPAMARLADLTVFPHPDTREDEAAADCLHAVLFDSGRPVLIAPRVPPPAIGSRCCVAWNGTAESATALSAMLPWLRQAQAVRILHAGAYQRRGPHAAEAAAYLRRHDIQADVTAFAPLSRDVGAGLLAAAADFGADLLGMGAYSHSRLRQLIVGGVTRHVLENSALPVLMTR